MFGVLREKRCRVSALQRVGNLFPEPEGDVKFNRPWRPAPQEKILALKSEGRIP